MKFRDIRPSTEVKVDMTSLIDVVFLLLIFFMVSTNFDKLNQLNIEIPKSTELNNYNDVALEIGVNAQGEYFFLNQAYGKNLLDLKFALEEQLKINSNMQIAIVGDKIAPHQSIVSIMDVANQLGIQKLQVIARASPH